MEIVIHPSGGDDLPLPAADFVRQMDALRQLLTHAGHATETRILKLHMNSPATVVMDALGAHDSPLNLTRFFDGIDAIASRGEAPPEFGRPVFDALREFASAIGKGLRRAILSLAGREIVFDIAAKRRIEEVFGPDTSSEGSLDGMLEGINVHGKSNVFALYPVVGPTRVTCKFDSDMLPGIRPALGKYVSIQGVLKYRWREKFPYEATASKLEIMDDNQPSFLDILGLAPEATGGVPSEDFIKNVRHGWDS